MMNFFPTGMFTLGVPAKRTETPVNQAGVIAPFVIAELFCGHQVIIPPACHVVVTHCRACEGLDV